MKMNRQEKESSEESEGETHEKEIQLEETVGELKKEKPTKMTAFTKVRRYLLTLIQEEVNVQEIKDACEKLNVVLESNG